MNILAILNIKKENLQFPLSSVFFAIYNLTEKLMNVLILTKEDREEAGIYLGYEKSDE